MSHGFDFQVTYNSSRRKVNLKLVQIGPRGGVKEVFCLNRRTGQQLHDDLGAALRMMDDFTEHFTTATVHSSPDPEPEPHMIDEDVEIDVPEAEEGQE